MLFRTLIPAALLVGLATAQDEPIINPTTAAPSATAVPTANGYSYAGCWNETVNFEENGGARALGEAGNFTADNALTIDSCLEFCGDGSFQYAGLEYGRECYCSPYISTLSEKLNDSECTFACNGNASQICGGTLAITLYNRTESSATNVAWSLGGQSAFYEFAALVFMLIAAFL